MEKFRGGVIRPFLLRPQSYDSVLTEKGTAYARALPNSEGLKDNADPGRSHRSRVLIFLLGFLPPLHTSAATSIPP
jgi:hypothetical protein